MTADGTTVARHADEPRSSEGGPPSDAPCILVVDDSPTQVQGLRHFLEGRGFRTEGTSSGEEALEALATGGVDLVLSDVVMPGMSGYDLCRAIKTDPDLHPPPSVVLLTSLSDPVDIVRGLESQADNYVTKPYDADRLVERLHQVLAARDRGGEAERPGQPITLDFLGRSFEIRADRRQILQLLLASYEELVRTNSALAESRAQLDEAHQREMAIEHRVREEVERSAERLALVARASALFSEAESPQEVAETLNGVLNASVAWAATFLFTGDDLEGCRLESILGESGSSRGHGVDITDDDRTFLHGLAEDAHAHHLDDDERARIASLLEGNGVTGGHESEGPAIAVALRWRRRALGVLVVGQKAGEAFDNADTPILENIAGRAAVAVDGQRLLAQEKKARTTAEDAIQLRDDVMATVSHDLRNTIGVAYSGASLLLDIDLPEEAKRRQLELIKRAAEQANRLIEDLFVVATQESGTFAVDPRPVRVSDLLEEAETLLAPLAADKSVELKVEVARTDSVVRADPDRIFRVFSNLVGNAIKYTPEGGSVRLAAEVGEDWVTFEVEDSGPGISEEALPRVFDRFYQVEKREGKGGAGLGLAIAHAIVTAHGGTIEAESEEGVGSLFRFRLPCPDADCEPDEVPRSARARFGELD